MAGCAPAAPPKPHRIDGWGDFRARFMQPDGRVIDTGNRGISHTESQGYGMVMAEAANDRESFERIYDWTQRTLARHDDALYSWRYDPSLPQPVSDPNNATDGDILIAWALLRAGQRWKVQAWRDRSAQIRASIRMLLIRQRGKRTLLVPGIQGFFHPDRLTINLSYYIWPALDAFRQADGDAAWGPVIRDGEKLLTDARAGPLALPTDWTDVFDDGRALPAIGKDPYFGFDAIRVPLYLSLAGRQNMAPTIARFWHSYADQNRPIPAWVDVVTGAVAPYAISEGGCAVVRRLLGSSAPSCTTGGQPDYYASVLKTLSTL
ncbi:endoglucanase [Sphingomonas zeicaulis]|uniref:glycosyl hydrolase family 8 n=1 Tax=Sphingomonas zeicaulis TaxID=1632740 RepID=UPI003D2506E6